MDVTSTLIDSAATSRNFICDKCSVLYGACWCSQMRLNLNVTSTYKLIMKLSFGNSSLTQDIQKYLSNAENKCSQ